MMWLFGMPNPVVEITIIGILIYLFSSIYIGKNWELDTKGDTDQDVVEEVR